MYIYIHTVCSLAAIVNRSWEAPDFVLRTTEVGEGWAVEWCSWTALSCALSAQGKERETVCITYYTHLTYIVYTLYMLNFTYNIASHNNTDSWCGSIWHFIPMFDTYSIHVTYYIWIYIYIYIYVYIWIYICIYIYMYIYI